MYMEFHTIVSHEFDAFSKNLFAQTAKGGIELEICGKNYTENSVLAVDVNRFLFDEKKTQDLGSNETYRRRHYVVGFLALALSPSH